MSQQPTDDIRKWVDDHAEEIENNCEDGLSPLIGDRCMLGERDEIVALVEQGKKMIRNATGDRLEMLQHLIRQYLIELFLIDNPDVEFEVHDTDFVIVEESDAVLFKLKYCGGDTFPPIMPDEQ